MEDVAGAGVMFKANVKCAKGRIVSSAPLRVSVNLKCKQCTSGGVAHVVLAAGNKWHGSDERRIGDQNADKMNLHDAH